ncbi:MAG: LysM domain-containing protein, partial [bacterium]|nr:LysM domain-containing protein [bacterium]
MKTTFRFLGAQLILIVVISPLLALAATGYIVKSGDTLGKIATANHLSLTQIVALNPQIKNINLIYPGQVVQVVQVSAASTVPVPSPVPTPTPTPVAKKMPAPKPAPAP